MKPTQGGAMLDALTAQCKALLRSRPVLDDIAVGDPRQVTVADDDPPELRSA